MEGACTSIRPSSTRFNISGVKTEVRGVVGRVRQEEEDTYTTKLVLLAVEEEDLANMFRLTVTNPVGSQVIVSLQRFKIMTFLFYSCTTSV